MTKKFHLIIMLMVLMVVPWTRAVAEPLISDYEAYPIFTVNPVEPNILVILDNSGSMNFNAFGSYPGDGGLVIDEPYSGTPYDAEATRYYGYFNPDWFYRYDSNLFVHAYKKIGHGTTTCPTAWEVQAAATVTGGGNASQCLNNAAIAGEALWDGNWLNWAAMRRVDIARKVLMGGKATPRINGGTLYGEDPAQATRHFRRQFDSSAQTDVTPYHGNFLYGIRDGYIYVDTNNNGNPYVGYDRFHLRIRLNETFDPESFKDGELAGVFQRVGGERARWGNMWFYSGTGSNLEGGRIANRVGSNMVDMTADFQNTGCNTWTPLGETYYVAMQYFKQEEVDTSLGYHPLAGGPRNNLFDPYHHDGEFIHCAKSFVLLISDGASTKDARIPTELKDYAGEGSNVNCNEVTGADCDYPSGGTKFLRDIALYARTNDLRPDLADTQNLILYTVLAAFGSENQEMLDARELLMDAARKGGPIPWDGDNSTIPENYFEASDGYQLEEQLTAAINDILRQAASGTAVSVLATSAEGEGNLVQAYFQPVVADGVHETKWVGYLQSLWMDDHGMMREDSDGDAKLDITQDRVLRYFVGEGGDTMIKVYGVSEEKPYPDFEDEDLEPEEIISLNQVKPIWEAGDVLAWMLPSERKIFTAIDDSVPVAPEHALFGGVRFNNDSGTLLSLIRPYLGVKDDAAWSYLGASHDDRAHNLIHYIRGNDDGLLGTVDVRQRTVDGRTWPLGDIVHSTPVSVAVPPDNFGIIYSDPSYQEFFNFHKNRGDRETVVYVGANDGMLHAFTSWQYDKDAKEFVRPEGVDPSEKIGAEIWAYIPRALLPQLKWLPRQDYSHVFYVDLKPKIFDARIFYNDLGDPFSGTIDDTYHKNGWGTILLGGLGLGGQAITVTDDFGSGDTSQVFSASYFAIDISNPRQPELLWERSYDGLNFSLVEPVVLKVGDKWFLTFGSGPQTSEGTMTGTDTSKIYVVDLATGEPYRHNGIDDWLFEGDNPRAFMATPASLDKWLNFTTDAAYFGESYLSITGDWQGAIYKLTIPRTDDPINNPPAEATYEEDPLQWTFHRLFDAPGPITGPPALSEDFSDNTMIFFGTGRYFNQDDKIDISEQYLFGIKDPFYNRAFYEVAPDDYYLNYSNVRDPLTQADLFAADTAVVTGNSLEFSTLLNEARSWDGWWRTLQTSGERSLNKPAILGGLSLFTTYVPLHETCAFGGESYLYALYFETGTAYRKPVFRDGFETVDGVTVVRDRLWLGTGKASGVGLHVSRQADGRATGFIQQSTGVVAEIDLDPAFAIRSGYISWEER